MLHDPARIDAHVVGHHVAGEPDPVRPGALLEAGEGRLATEVRRDRVVVEGVGRGQRVGVAPPALDVLGRPAALPQADQPEPGDPEAGEPGELVVGDLVEGPDRPAVRARELIEPDIGALRQQDQLGHPGHVVAEPFRFGIPGRAGVAGECAKAAQRGTGGSGTPAPEPGRFLRDDPEPDEQAIEEASAGRAQDGGPAVADEDELAGQRRGRGAGRRLEQGDQVLVVRPETRPGREVAPDGREDRPVARVRRQHEGRVVHQGLQRPYGRVRGGQVGQQQLAQPVTRPGMGRREGRPVGAERRGGRPLADGRAHGLHGVLERRRVDLVEVAVDDDPEDLVEEARGPGRRRPGPSFPGASGPAGRRRRAATAGSARSTGLGRADQRQALPGGSPRDERRRASRSAIRSSHLGRGESLRTGPLDGPPEELEAGRVELVDPLADPLLAARTGHRGRGRSPPATGG